MKLSALFSDNMVVQSGKPFPVSGIAVPDSEWTATLTGCGQSLEQSIHVAGNGTWQTAFPPLPVGGPYQLRLKKLNQEELSQEYYIHNILSGEVWLCAGQSNMAMSVAEAADAAHEIESAQRPNLRMFTVPRGMAAKPRDWLSEGSWKVCSSATVGQFSAVGYFFARELQSTLPAAADGSPCPIGIINASWGDTTAEAWTSREALEQEPTLVHHLRRWDELLAQHPEARQDLAPYFKAWHERSREYEREHVEWLSRAMAARLSAREYSPGPPRPTGLGDNHAPTVLYNAMIAPLTSFPLRGVCWYQGESNAINGSGQEYYFLFKTLIKSWRNVWQNPELPFLFVQLANHKDVRAANPEKDWPELREAQRKVLSDTSHTAMIVAIDVGETEYIHPKNKQAVGRRLVLAARGLVYGHEVEFRGPMPKILRRRGHQLQVVFDHAEGLKTWDGKPPRGFQIAGEDDVFYTAQVEIEADSILLSNDEILYPVAMRYGWSDDPDCNLCNSDGLPATPYTVRL